MRHLALLALGVLGCGGAEAQSDGKRGTAAPETESASTTRVEVAVIVPSEARLEFVLPGEVEGARDALLAAAQGGYVERVTVKEGDRVRRGKVLALVDSAMNRVRKDQAEAELRQAEADLARARALRDNISPAQVEAAQTRVTLAGAAVRAARIQLGRSVVKAPFSGVVARVGVEVGEVAAPGAPIVRLVELDALKITVAVSDRDVVSLRPGTRVSVTTDALPEPIPGSVARISPAGDLRTRSFEAEVEIENADGRLLPGMIASVRVSEPIATDALVVPQDFLVTRLDGVGVFVEAGGVASWRPLELGAVVGRQVVVESGLSIGDRVVFTGQRSLAEGDRLLVAREGRCCEGGRVVFAAAAGATGAATAQPETNPGE